MSRRRTILYVVRRPPDALLLQAVEHHLALGYGVEILLVQDGVTAAELPDGAFVAHLGEDAGSRGVAGHGEAVDYGRMLEILHAADAAIVW